jgi:hypothetical protein
VRGAVLSRNGEAFVKQRDVIAAKRDDHDAGFSEKLIDDHAPVATQFNRKYKLAFRNRRSTDDNHVGRSQPPQQIFKAPLGLTE